ncbi:ABC transporter, permease protein (cluster 3, basic aa/glutamine/opines) [Olavius algarvensis associated proteobacterium Delta 3]|nr:ABC transporter, permease protein (cluster 3, basic aa/glutamine/opines) [Olavius algarvensis associated proteobacterium Delta 3]
MKRTVAKRILPELVVGVGILAAVVFLALRIHTGLHYRWDWGAIPQFLVRFDPELSRWVPNLLLEGLLTTIRLSVWGTLLATLFGTVMGLFRVSPRLFRRLLGRTYVELTRNLPPLVLVFIFYFFISDQIMPALGVDEFVRNSSARTQSLIAFFFAPPGMFSAFLSAVITLALFEGAYITEIVRAGIESIEKGQWEAAAGLGCNRRQTLRHIILPQAIRRILPPLAGQFISTIKDSAIVSVISIQELTFQGMELMAATHLTFEIWITITLLYLVLTFSCAMLVQRCEHIFFKRRVYPS